MELEQLITTEQRLDEALRGARADAARVIAEARATASRAEAALTAEIAAASSEMEAAAAVEMRDRSAAVEREAAEQVARTDGVAAARIRALARDLVPLLVADQSP